MGEREVLESMIQGYTSMCKYKVGTVAQQQSSHLYMHIPNQMFWGITSSMTCWSVLGDLQMTQDC